MSRKQRLELTWVGKEARPKLEPRILLFDPDLSYHSAKAQPNSSYFDNILIYGDNLLALKALESNFFGKVKCIFIDPPYNTGSAFEHYDDFLEHSIWLSLLRSRLELLQALLSEDGSIWICIDDREVHYLKVLCDEIFGRRNFLANFIWQKSYGGGSKARWFVGLHEHILCYAKNIQALPDFWLPPDPEISKKYYKYKDEKFLERGPYRLQPLATTSMDDRPNLRYPIYLPDGRTVLPEKQWQWSKNRVEAAIRQNEIVFTERGGKITVSYKQYLKSADGEERGRKPNTIITGFYTQHGSSESVALFGEKNKFPFPKPEALVQYIIQSCTRPGDLVLDSFAGSGTTGAVAHKMGRRWIMVELGEHCHTHIIPRMRKVIDGEDPGGITKAVGWKGGGGFRYYRLAPSLIERDQWGLPVISKQYNPAMLAEAMCKLMGFRYDPSPDVFWQQGRSSERDFIYTTTRTLTHKELAAISAQVGDDRTLLICCKAFRMARPDAFPNLTVKKIPNAVLAKCEWGKDDYSLNVANLPMAAAVEEPAPPKRTKRRSPTPDLFDQVNAEEEPGA